MEQVICEECLMSGMGFKLFFHGILTEQSFIIRVVFLKIKLLTIPVSSITSAQIVQSTFGGKLTINYISRSEFLRVITLSTSKPEEWKIALKKRNIETSDDLG